MNLPKITLARKSGWQKFVRSALSTKRMATFVGVPAEKKSRKSEKINNAELLYVLSKGSPLRNLPATPWVEPAVQADGNRQRISAELRDYARAAMMDDWTTAKRFLRRAGMAGQNAARGWPTDARNGWPRLAESTERARLRKMGRQRGLQTTKQLAEFERGNASYPFTRNVDTGALRAAITHVERDTHK